MFNVFPSVLLNVKVKLSLCFTKHHALIYGAVEV